MNQQFVENKVPIWINQICEKIIESLVQLQKPCKYIVNCMIQQRNGAGAIVSSSCYWDTSCDGCSFYLGALIYIWPKEK
jgi:dynein light chain Tctex-type 1